MNSNFNRKFYGSFEEFKEKLKTINGHWKDLDLNKKVFKFMKALMNWYPYTGTITFQGDAEQSLLLEQLVKIALDENEGTVTNITNTNIKTNIIIKFQIEGIHNWPSAESIEPEVAFLSDKHRHIFHCTCKKEVSHSDRDVEIILFKRKVIDYLQVKYGCFERKEIKSIEKQPLAVTLFQFCDFGSMSCEMIAQELLTTFDLTYCEILEDGENGACVELTN